MGKKLTIHLPAKKDLRFRLLPLLSSLVTGAAFLNSHLALLVFVGLVPFIYYMKHAKSLRRKQIYLDCAVAGFIYWCLVWIWILQMIPGTWIDVHGRMFVIMKVLVLLLSAIISSVVFGAVIATLIAKLRNNMSRLLLALPFVWALSELLHSYSLALFTLGPGSSLSPNWNFGVIGLAVSATPLAYLARFVGLYGLTIVAVAINIALYLLIKKRYAPALLVVMPILLLNIVACRAYTPTGRQIKVAAVHISKNESVDSWRQLPLPARDTSVLVLPEYSHFLEKPSNIVFARQHFGQQMVIVTSRASSATKPAFNELTYYTPQDGYISTQPKTFLAPYGEYLPYIASGLLRASGQQSVIDKFHHDGQVKPGLTPEHAVTYNNLAIGGLACSGVLDLDEYRRLSGEGAQVLVNSASLAILDSASLYRVQERYQNRFHAIANARPYVQAARSGESYILSSDGEIIAHTTKSPHLIEAPVKLQPKRTVYSLF